ncbi:MAG: DUF4398 domain-containing protein [Spirochaetaceae bacterium]|jgi:hypothetical protein|nr:DUF4398 domain-containing protein [Spirochaetaceae bacterium]
MKLRKLWIVGIVGLAAFIGTVVITACAKPPTEEMEAARTAVARAENDPDVAIYAVSTLARAREALASMEAEALAKRYDSARNYAAEAVSNAEKAINDARTAMTRAREDSANAMNALRNAITETDTAVTQGKSNKLPLDWNQIDNDFEDAQTVAGEAEAAQADSRYRNAVELANTARTTLSAITSQISGASLAQTRKK